MNKTYQEGRDLAKSLINAYQVSDTRVILGVPAIVLRTIANQVEEVTNLDVAAQNCHQEPSGAYTGEISAAMVASTGAKYVILGHSERRQYFGEDGALLAQKINIALEHGLRPIFCCGEPLEVREADTQAAYVQEQIKAALFHLSAEQMEQIVIAYEPIWAIGTGKTASPEQAQAMHAHIRGVLAAQYSSDLADGISILYGGSVKPANAEEIFAQADVDGGLVGGASLKVDDFAKIIEAAPRR